MYLHFISSEMNQINLKPTDSQEQMKGRGRDYAERDEGSQYGLFSSYLKVFFLIYIYIYIIADNVHNMSFIHYGAGVREGEGLAVC